MKKLELPYLLWEILVNKNVAIEYNDDIKLNANADNISEEFLSCIMANAVYSDLYDKSAELKVDMCDYDKFLKTRYDLREEEYSFDDEFGDTFYDLVNSSPEINSDQTLKSKLNNICRYMLDSEQAFTEDDLKEYSNRDLISSFEMLMAVMELSRKKSNYANKVATNALRMIDVASDNQIDNPNMLYELYYESKSKESDEDFIERNKLISDYSSKASIIRRVSAIEKTVILEMSKQKKLTL